MIAVIKLSRRRQPQVVKQVVRSGNSGGTDKPRGSGVNWITSQRFGAFFCPDYQQVSRSNDGHAWLRTDWAGFFFCRPASHQPVYKQIKGPDPTIHLYVCGVAWGEFNTAASYCDSGGRSIGRSDLYRVTSYASSSVTRPRRRSTQLILRQQCSRDPDCGESACIFNRYNWPWFIVVCNGRQQ